MNRSFACLYACGDFNTNRSSLSAFRRARPITQRHFLSYVTKYEYFYCRLWNYRDWITVVIAWRLMTKHSVLSKNNSWIHNNKNAKKGKNGKRGSRKSLLMILIWQNGIKSRKTDLILIWVINATGLLPRSSFKTFCWRHESYFFKFLF